MSDKGNNPTIERVTRQRTVTHVVLPKGAKLPRHRHERSYFVHPLRPGLVKRTIYEDGKAVQVQHQELRVGYPYCVDVGEKGLEVEIENEGDDTEWDKDE
jgi:hypothetical protein